MKVFDLSFVLKLGNMRIDFFFNIIELSHIMFNLFLFKRIFDVFIISICLFLCWRFQKIEASGIASDAIAIRNRSNINISAQIF